MEEFAAFGLWRDVYNNGHLGPHTAAAVRGMPGRGEFLLLREVAVAATGGPDDEHRTPVLAALAEVFAAVWPRPGSLPAMDRMMAFGAVVSMLRHPDLAGRRADVVATLTAEVAAQPDRLLCATGLLILGEAGAAPREFLDDPRLAVRVCAALAPALARDEAATRVLIDAARRPAAFDYAFAAPFTPEPQRLKVPWQWREMPHRALLAALCARVTDFEQVHEAALAALALRGSAFEVFLPVAFPDGRVPDGGTARRFARAITRQVRGWEQRVREAGFDAEQWRAAAASMAGTRDPVIVLRRPDWTVREDPGGAAQLIELLAGDGYTAVLDGKRLTVEGPPVAPAAVAPAARFNPSEAPGHFALAVAAVWSRWVTVWTTVAGVTRRQQWVDTVPMGPVETVDGGGVPDGSRIVFELR